MRVCDASVVVAVLCRTGSTALDESFESAIEGGLHAPHLLDLEVASALRRRVAHKAVGLEIATAGLRSLAELPIHRYSHTGLLNRAWTLRENISIYDAAYVALAEAIDAPLLTTDARLARSAADLIEVELHR